MTSDLNEYIKVIIEVLLVEKCGLFTTYQQKPVSTRFVQMVSKNSRLRNSVEIGAYHLHNPFKFAERV